MKPFRIIGIESSPYAVKVRAVMRYRHIAHRWVSRMPQYYEETAGVRPRIMPVVQFPDGEYRTDSSPIIRDLEHIHPGERSIVPTDPGDALLSEIIEDLADEWLTKSLFHYRFSRARDAQSGASWVMDDAHPDAAGAEHAAHVSAFIARQTARMPLVGCTPENGPLLEKFYADVLAVLEEFAATDCFLFGSRPAIADFGLYGQLKTLAVDPTPREILRNSAPRTEHWVLRLDDTSGVEGQWASTLVPAVRGLLELAGRYYFPFLAANRRALEAGEDAVEVEIEGCTYRQPVYRYQRKCYDYLTMRHGALAPDARERIAPLLRECDCLAYLATPD